ncbi:MAG: hypothetical protein ACI9ES_003032 [Oceanospirillaceae bacterium]
MRIFKFLTICLVSASVMACTTVEQKAPAADAKETVEQQSDAAVKQKPLIAKVDTPSNRQIAAPDNISIIQSQLTALQEQVIKLSSDSAAMLKMNQLILANSQVQTATSQSVSGSAVQSSQNTPAANNSGSLNSILTKLETISPSPEGAFGIVSSYTASKQWVLIRFDRQSGETWLADKSGWNALSESGDLEISQYDVHLIRADQDRKGYVASRIDQRSGDTWWLNKNQWVVYQ